MFILSKSFCETCQKVTNIQKQNFVNHIMFFWDGLIDSKFLIKIKNKANNSIIIQEEVISNQYILQLFDVSIGEYSFIVQKICKSGVLSEEEIFDFEVDKFCLELNLIS